MTWRPIRAGIAAAALLGLIAAASVLATAPGGGPTRARTLLEVVALPWRVGRLSSGAPTDDGPAPVPAVALPPYFDALRLSPPRVGLQAGHWKADELPPEQAHLRDSTGAVAGPFREADINLRIARLAAAILQGRGITVDLLPATVPPGYEADTFVSIHADGGPPGNRGWKISSAWRGSPASRVLAADVAGAYGMLSGLPEDRYGVTYLMHGYYAYSWYRYDHATAPWTPAVIIECGFVTSAADREVLVGDPGRAAQGIAVGILTFLGHEAQLPDRSFVPVRYPPMVVSAAGSTLRKLPGESESAAAVLEEGTVVRPLDEEDGWYEVMVWGNYRTSGWVPAADLAPAG